MKPLLASLAFFASAPAESIDYLPMLESRANRWDMMSGLFLAPADEAAFYYSLGRRDGLREAAEVVRWQRRQLTN